MVKNDRLPIACPLLANRLPKYPYRILITGANSYIGTSFEKWLGQWPDKYSVETVDMIDGSWREKSFVGYDVVFHVAGIAHVSADPAKESLYYKVNRDLAIETAQKAKNDGVRQFIFMSSMIVYGKDEPAGSQKVITSETQLLPSDFYGRSKLEADLAIQEMTDENFAVSIMRPPVIYGPGCKGNFPRLIDLAKRTFIFPNISNVRSMLYIDNLCEFLRILIENRKSGVFFPQNNEYVSTRDVIIEYRKLNNKKTILMPFPGFLISLMSKIEIFNKAFGTKIYDKKISQFDLDYNVVDFKTSLKRMSV